MLQHLTKAKIAAVWSAIFVAGATAGWLGFQGERERVWAELIVDTKRSAVAFNGEELRGLTGTRADLTSPLYAETKRRLIELRAVNERVRFVYLFRSKPESDKVIYLGDSAKAGAKDESLPGDDYPQALDSPGLQDVLRTGMATTEGPLRDNFGVWITGYAVLDEVASAHSGRRPSRQIVGLDIAADGWSRSLWAAGFQWAFYVWVLLGVPFGALLVMRRQLDQREAIRNLSEAMEQSHSALMIVDLDSCIEYANRGLCQQIGYSRRELIGRKWRDFQVAETPPELLAELVSTVRSGKSWEGEWFNRRKDGAIYPVRGVITPVKRRDGSLACFVAVFDDMTEIKRKEAELRDARDLAQAGDRAKGQFLATMSHEVRTPLNGIVGFTNLLLDTPLSPEQREFAQTIRSSSEALIQLTGDILDFARIESGKMVLEPVACAPRECIEEALDLFATAAANKRIELLHRVQEDVPMTILADAGRLRQVLVNLVNNAVKFTEKGVVELTVVVATDDDWVRHKPVGSAASTRVISPRNVTLLFAVRDTGIGIAADQQEKLFKPFTQVDGTSTRKFGGTGLGLAICRNLVRLMGGEVVFTSEVGRGSLFSFVVQVAVAEPAKPRVDLSAVRLAVVAAPGALRSELVGLAQGWRAQLLEVDELAALQGREWDTAIIDVDEKLARALTAPGAAALKLPVARVIGLVPIALPNELRSALRAHFRLLVNKPVHHEALFALLCGLTPDAAVAPRKPVRFGLRVLLVEDNAVNQRLMQKVLTNFGCQFTVADNGRCAVDELKQVEVSYDVVLMDLHMPEMDGMTAIKEIREGRAGVKNKDLWIITLTADAREAQREHALAAGANDYLVKPLQLRDLEVAFQRFGEAQTAAK